MKWTCDYISTVIGNVIMQDFELSPVDRHALTPENDISVNEIVHLLTQQFIIISGGKSKEKCPIITFPDNGAFHLLSDEDYKKLLLYVTSVPSMQEVDHGFVLIVDRTNDKWCNVRHILYKFTEFFPGLIHVVYIVRPTSFFQKAISEVSNKFFREDFKFKVIICNNLDELHEYIDKKELTEGFNGELPYCNEDWIQQRISLEQFSTAMKAVSASMDEFTRRICNFGEGDFPKSVDDLVILLNEHTTAYGDLKQRIMDSSGNGEKLLLAVKRGASSAKIPPSAVNNVSAIERLLVQLDETEKIFDEFWQRHVNKLRQCLELRSFEEDYKGVQERLKNRLQGIVDTNDLGESVDHIECLICELNDYKISCEADIKDSESLVQRGITALEKPKYVNLSEMRRMCDELLTSNVALAQKLSYRMEILIKAKELQIRINKANEWCARGIEFLGRHNIDKIALFSADKAEKLLKELEQFVASADDFNVSGSEDLFLFQSTGGNNLEAKTLVTQVLQRIEDVTVMCEKRITSLRRLLVKSNRPVLSVSPATNGFPPQINGITGEQEVCDMVTRLLRSLTLKCPGNGVIGSIRDTTKCKIYHIMRELYDTEEIYVTEISNILKGYKEEMTNPAMKALIPPELEGKEDVLFCNLQEIRDFHGSIFLPELRACESNVRQVANLFQNRQSQFLHLYSYYCQNMSKSDRLREKAGERNAFFMACQSALGHKLPLAAYLLKPVQRITKYQLLLKDLTVNTADEDCQEGLRQALACMLSVLRCVNDRMHQISITGYGEADEQGDLLLQAPFAVWLESKKDLLLKASRLKATRRHVFLFRKAVVFCKKTTHAKGVEYQFKGALKTSQIGLTETVRGDGKKFEIWLSGRQEIYVLQAQSLQQKDQWVREIKKVLFEQLTELKGELLKQYAEKWPFRTFSLEGLPGNISSGGASRGNSRPNSHHEMDEGSSSDASNSDDEESISSSNLKNGKFVAMADYCASGKDEVSLKEGDKLELLKFGSPGWWYVKIFDCGSEGWVPSSYLEEKEMIKKSKTSNSSTNSQQSQNSESSNL